MTIEDEPYDHIVTRPFCDKALLRGDFPGFREDYLVIHSLLRRYLPRSVIEIGTSTGLGTNVICNALGVPRSGWRGRVQRSSDIRVYSIDVPPDTDPNIIYPEAEDGHPRVAGADCVFRYHQIYGNSTTYDFSSLYPLDAWFIDGKHNYEYAQRDTAQALKAAPILIIWHDLQIPDVERAVADSMRAHPYRINRVGGTRVGYAVRA